MIVRRCRCGCGEIVEGRPNKRYATPACKKRAEWAKYAPRAKEMRRRP